MFASVSRCVISFGVGRRPCPGEGFRAVFGQIFGDFSDSAEDERKSRIKGWRRNRRSALSLLPAVRAVDGGFNAVGCGVYSEDFLYDWRLTSVKGR